MWLGFAEWLKNHIFPKLDAIPYMTGGTINLRRRKKNITLKIGSKKLTKKGMTLIS